MIHGITLLTWLMVCVTSVGTDEAYLLTKALAVMGAFYVGLAICVKIPFYGMLVGPIASIVMTAFKYGENHNSMYGFLMGVNYFAIFHAQGVYSQVFA